MKKNIDAVQKVLDADYRDGVECDYRRVDSTDSDDDYNRQSTLEDVHVTDINLENVTNHMAEYFGKDEFTKYTIDRLLTACQMYRKDKWDVNISWGYYGEEVNGIYLSDKHELGIWLEKLKNTNNDKEKLLLALKCEYGYILDELNSVNNWNIETINKSDIKIGQQDYYRKLEKDVVAGYKKYSLPRGIVILNNGNYKLIDGYHRILASGDEKIKVIVGK